MQENKFDYSIFDYMKNIFILICLCLCYMASIAQAPRPEPTPITRDSALKLRTGQEALGIPLTDSIVSGTVSFITRNSNDSKTWSPAKGMSDNLIQQLIKQSHTHDRMVFSDFVVSRRGKQIKIDKKTFVFK
jgi:hypothetical protein